MISINLTGKKAIVTGGASGLGKAIALKMAEAGCDVAIGDMNFEGAQEVAKQIKKMNVDSMAFKVDTSNEEEFSKKVDEVVEKFGKLDIMVNNAGIGIMKPILDLTYAEINKLVDIDLKGVIYGTRAALRYMIPQKSGKIINLSSVAAKMGSPGASVYAAAKNGVIALSNSLAREVAEFNININIICPGIIRTNMWENQLELMTNNGDDALKNKVFNEFSSSQIPLKRPQEPEDIGHMVVFLASDLAKNITGQTINVDGGCAIH